MPAAPVRLTGVGYGRGWLGGTVPTGALALRTISPPLTRCSAPVKVAPRDCNGRAITAIERELR